MFSVKGLCCRSRHEHAGAMPQFSAVNQEKDLERRKNLGSCSEEGEKVRNRDLKSCEVVLRYHQSTHLLEVIVCHPNAYLQVHHGDDLAVLQRWDAHTRKHSVRIVRV